jgi:hypothetical protein
MEQQRIEEQIRWWEQQWLAIESDDNDSAVLGRRFGLFAGGGGAGLGGSFVNLASPAGTASLSSTLTRPHFGGNTATWLSPFRTLASYGLTQTVRQASRSTPARCVVTAVSALVSHRARALTATLPCAHRA